MFRHMLFAATAILFALASTGSVRAEISQSGSVIVNSGSVIVGTPQAQTQPAADGVLTVTPPSTLTTGAIKIGADTSQVSKISGALYVPGGAVNVTSSTSVGSTSDGRLEVTSGGIFQTRELLVGGVGTSNLFPVEGSVLVAGTGSRLISATPTIGVFGIGALVVRDGGVMTSGPQASTSSIAALGVERSSLGSVIVEGDGSAWQHIGAVHVGDQGLGQLSILQGGVATGAAAIVGRGAEPFTGDGRVLIDGVGSRWSVGSLTIGDRGAGMVQVTNGGTLDVAATSSINSLTIGAQPGAFGRLVVSGPSSKLQLDGALTVGGASGGVGEMFIEGGAFVTAGFGSPRPQSAVIGAGSSAGAGLVTVRGEGSLWRVNGLRVGTEGQGELRIDAGAAVEFANLGTTEIASRGRLLLTGGTLRGSTVQSKFSVRGLAEGYGTVDVDSLDVSGVLQVAAEKKLRVAGAVSATPSARIELGDAELEIDGRLTLGKSDAANAVLNIDHSVLRVRGSFPPSGSLTPTLTNGGQINVLGGANRVDASVLNEGEIRLLPQSSVLWLRDVTNRGALAVAEGAATTFLGALAGGGVSGPGEVRLEGAVRPAVSPDAPAPMAFGGDVTLGSLARLEIDVLGGAAGEFDRLTVDGDLQLDGRLTLTAATPLAVPTTLTILSAGDLLGRFAATPEIGSTIGFGVRFNGLTYDDARDEVLVSLLPPLTGDFNFDGAVDGADLLTWQTQLGDSATTAAVTADGNRDGTVDAADLDMIAEAMGAAAESAVAAAVPEPAVPAMLVAVGLAAFRRRRA